VAGTTRLAPEALLSLGKALEREAGREEGPRYGPRPLDVDLLVYGGLVLAGPELTVPHPRLRERRFALAPLADLAADLELPPDGARVADLLAAVGQEREVERLAWAIMPAAPTPPG
jgi:2-amino-4-hydroxy-6-hydroxymethyldihydropteridine diphosphokinase